MPRFRTPPHTVAHRNEIGDRLAKLRCALCGERGACEFARRMGIPHRSWYNAEWGVPCASDVILKIIVETRVSPLWLLRGEGPMFIGPRPIFRVEPPRQLRPRRAVAVRGPVDWRDPDPS